VRVSQDAINNLDGGEWKAENRLSHVIEKDPRWHPVEEERSLH